MRNTYIFFRDDQCQIEVIFDVQDPCCLDQFGYPYLGRLLNEFEKLNPELGITFYVTAWTLHRLPSYSKKTVVFIMQDEWSRSPHYLHKVGAVFVACSSSPSHFQAMSYGSHQEKIANFCGYLKAVIKDGIKGRPWRFLRKKRGIKLAPVFEIPLGYFSNEPVEFIPFEQRKFVFGFAGSKVHTNQFFKLPRAKTIARNRMFDAIEVYQKENPQCAIFTKVTQSYEDSIVRTGFYNRMMMNSKFCLVPRGANLETFRYYEAIRYGCIPIIESHPDLPYYKNAPLLKLNDWSELHSVLTPLLQEPQKMMELHIQILQWWHEKCSEKAIALFVADQLALIKAD